jgi:aldehyde dehydrogenase (NAD+)
MKIEGKAELEALFKAQEERRWAIASTNASSRVAKLRKLRDAILRRQDELYAAIMKDYGKSPFESWLTEVFPSIAELDHTIKGLGKWMKDEKARGCLILPGAKSYVRYEPKGRVLIMSPWNYPFQLLIAPIVSAIAAGNVVIAKPSNKTPATSAFLASLLGEVFPNDEVAVVEGQGSVLGELLLGLPFDHFFFTGSPKIGAHVGEAAEKAHAGLTLELGGKSPTILLSDVDVPDAAAKIMWGKCLNAGQTCIAPDYLFCPRALVAPFVAAAAAAVKRMYGETAESRRASKDFVRIVDVSACRRHEELVKDALAKGAKLELGGTFDSEERYAPPTILTGVTKDMAIMAEEIFGPILPILAYDGIEEVFAFIHDRPKPLALYVFGKDRSNLDEVLDRTTSGSACVNDLIVQIENLDVPFGGIGMSGTGNYHGRYGFRAFSHERNYMRQGAINMTKAFYPPYGGNMQGWMKSVVELLFGMRRRGKRQ